MKLTKLSLAMIGCASLAAGAAHAAGPTLSDVLGNSGITESGWIDAAYTSTDAKDPLNSFSGSNASTFNVQQAGIQLAKQPASGFGGLLNITMGSDASVIKSAGATSGAASDFDVTQAFAQYVNGALTLQGGKYVTLASAEVISPTGNTNITRSIEFFQVPYTHTGVRATYAPSSTLTLIAGVNNGWDEEQDLDTGKTVELGLTWAPNSVFTWGLQGYSGEEQNANDAAGQSGVKGTRTLIDTVITVKATSALTLILNADSGKQTKGALDPVTLNTKDASWTSVVGYVNYQWTDKWRTSLRAETFDDSDGYKLGLVAIDPNTGLPVMDKNVGEATLTVGYAPDPAFELRGEVRQDKAEKKAFTDYSGKATDSVTTLAVEGLYKF